MTLVTHTPYPGVALVVTDHGSVLFGAPADAFKATKQYCTQAEAPFPRVLVAPQTMLALAYPQFNPEFFLYDFLFVYGAAFKPHLSEERLQLVLDPSQVENTKRSLWTTLVGPSRTEMTSYVDSNGVRLVDNAVVDELASISEHMAIKKGDAPRLLDDMIAVHTFDEQGKVWLFDGTVQVERDGPRAFCVKIGQKVEHIDLTLHNAVVPFATLPRPFAAQRPATFGVKTLGARGGFDLSGPTTGFLIWVNEKAVIYDGPVGTRYLLEQQGISVDDVGGVILSHCHEDHMGAFVELILSGRRPKVLTTEPIYRSALCKLSGYFGEPEDAVKDYINYQRVDADHTVEAFGASFDFFHAVHSIPTIGVSVRMRDPSGREHRMQISGDTLHHEGLDNLRSQGVISSDKHASMHSLIPSRRMDNTLFFADVGEALIHGHPKDWAGNPNKVMYYHCPSNDRTRSYGHPVTDPGDHRTLIATRTLEPLASARLLNALRPLEIDDPAWLRTLLNNGRFRNATPKQKLVVEGNGAGESCRVSVILSGTAAVSTEAAGKVASLRAGEYFGLAELVTESCRHEATITAETPMELFCVDAALFYDYLREQGREETLRRIWRQRPAVDGVRILRELDLCTRDTLAQKGNEQQVAPGDVIIEEGATEHDFYLLLQGDVELVRGGHVVATLSANNPDSFFGEACVSRPGEASRRAVVARSEVRVLHLDAETVRAAFADRVGIRYALELVLSSRCG